MKYAKCPGGTCPLKHTCRRYLDWVQSSVEDEFDWDMEPAYRDGACKEYKRVEYYGQ